jgi:hypothetical protein
MASPNEIEREVESQRAQVEHTLDELKRKMSFGQIVDEVGGYIGAEDTRTALRKAGRQVRDNPIAFGLVGIGLAWLMLGGGGRSRDDMDWDDGWDDRGRGHAGEAVYPGADGGARYGSAYGSPYDDVPGGGRDDARSGGSTLKRAARSVGEAVSGVGERLSGVVGGVGEGVSQAAGGVSETVSVAAGGVAERLSSARDAGERRLRRMGEHAPDAGRYGRRMRGALEETMERQPLLVGAVAAALGAAIGAALPNTRAEHRWLGERRDALLEEAKRAAKDAGEQALDAAKAGLDAASRAAQEEGLTPDPQGKTLAERVETVVRTGAEEARERLEDERAPEPVGGKSSA